MMRAMVHRCPGSTSALPLMESRQTTAAVTELRRCGPGEHHVAVVRLFTCLAGTLRSVLRFISCPFSAHSAAHR